MIVFIGADHNGHHLKAELIKHLKKSQIEVVDSGDKQFSPDDDYPVFAARLAHQLELSNDRDSFGVLICGSGQGINIAANRFRHIRAALCWNIKEAHAARNDDDCNVLSLSADSTSTDQAIQILNAFIATPFAGAPRFKRRIDELNNLP